jgi:hypothetical protein
MFTKKLLPVFSVFVLTNLIVFILKNYLPIAQLKSDFILVVNALLFGMSLFNHYRLSNNINNNPNAMVRSVMLGTLLKMVVFAGAALVYATQKKGPVGILTLIISMVLYLIYTFLEIQWTLKKKA